MRSYRYLPGVVVALAIATHAALARGQGYGTDLQNIMAPASGGMAGVSTARPQDVPSAIFGNPATLTQFQGTQFTLGGGWMEGYPTVTNDGSLNTLSPGTPFHVTSRTKGGAATEIGVTQDLRSLGLAGTLGMGVAGLSGGGAEYRGDVPENTILNNTSGSYLVLGINLGAGFQVTDRLSVGGTLTLGTGFEQLGLVGPIVGSAMVNAYALRGTFGVDYELNECNTLGFFYESKLAFDFPTAARVGNSYYDVHIAQPTTLGLGLANRSLMDGNLLLAVDAYYKLWDDAALWQDIMVNQWALALGAVDQRQHEVSHRLFLQQQSRQKQRGQQFRRAPVPGRDRQPDSIEHPVVPGLQRGVCQSEPHHGRRRPAGLPASGARRRSLCRRAAAGERQFRPAQHRVAGALLRRRRPHLALRRGQAVGRSDAISGVAGPATLRPAWIAVWEHRLDGNHRKATKNRVVPTCSGKTKERTIKPLNISCIPKLPRYTRFGGCDLPHL